MSCSFIMKVNDWLSPYIRLMRLDKPSGYLLGVADGVNGAVARSARHATLMEVGCFCAGCFVMRSAGYVINDYADSDLDERFVGK